MADGNVTVQHAGEGRGGSGHKPRGDAVRGCGAADASFCPAQRPAIPVTARVSNPVSRRQRPPPVASPHGGARRPMPTGSASPGPAPRAPAVCVSARLSADAGRLSRPPIPCGCQAPPDPRRPSTTAAQPSRRSKARVCWDRGEAEGVQLGPRRPRRRRVQDRLPWPLPCVCDCTIACVTVSARVRAPAACV